MASRGLTALPNEQLLSFLNSKMKDKFNKFVLIGTDTNDNATLKSLLGKTVDLKYKDIQNYIFKEGLCESTYFDDGGVFTGVVDLTNEDGYDKHLYAVGLFSEDRLIGTIAKTPIIFLSSQIGGVFPIKIPIRGDKGQVMFRSTKYLPEVEAEERFLEPLIEMLVMNTNIYTSLIEKEIKEVEDKKLTEENKKALESRLNSLDKKIDDTKDELLKPIVMNTATTVNIMEKTIKQEIKESK